MLHIRKIKIQKMSRRERIMTDLRQRRQNVMEGNINCIPSPFGRFRNGFCGIEQGKYYLISGLSKSSKTQIMSFLFLYNSVLYAYEHPEQLKLKIFYFPLEETPEAITLRFMSYLLYVKSGRKIRVQPLDLKSTNENKIVDEEILNILESKEYTDILDFFEEVVVFLSDRNPTGIFMNTKEYMIENGTVFYKTIDIERKDGTIESKKAFDYYVPDRPDEYVMCIIDHISLLESERGMDLRQTINKMSEYLIVLRNRYKVIPVVVQQQSMETGNLEAFKQNKIRPTLAGLADSKGPGKDCNMLLGMSNPHAFELPSYLGYNITKLKGNARFLEVVLNRDGESNDIIGLYFDGAVNYYTELPKPTESDKLENVYTFISNGKVKLFLMFNKLKFKTKNR